MDFNLAVIPAETAGSSPGRPVAVYAGGQMGYGELDGMSDRLATGLERAGLRPGDVVGLQLPNIPQFLIASFGILNAGGAVMPLNVMLEAPEVAFQLRDSGARFLLTFEAILDDAARGADVVITVLPLFHIFGMSPILNVCVRFGCTMSLVPRFDPAAVLTAIQRDRATIFDGVPAMFTGLLAYPALAGYGVSPGNARGKVVKDELVRDHGGKDSRNAAGGGGPWNE